MLVELFNLTLTISSPRDTDPECSSFTICRLQSAPKVFTLRPKQSSPIEEYQTPINLVELNFRHGIYCSLMKKSSKTTSKFITVSSKTGSLFQGNRHWQTTHFSSLWLFEGLTYLSHRHLKTFWNALLGWRWVNNSWLLVKIYLEQNRRSCAVWP